MTGMIGSRAGQVACPFLKSAQCGSSPTGGTGTTRVLPPHDGSPLPACRCIALHFMVINTEMTWYRRGSHWEQGNPPDAPNWPAVQRVKNRAGRAPRTVTADPATAKPTSISSSPTSSSPTW